MNLSGRDKKYGGVRKKSVSSSLTSILFVIPTLIIRKRQKFPYFIMK